MAALNLTPFSATAVAEALTAVAAGGDSFPLNSPIVVTFKNTGAASRTVTAVAQNACNHGVLHNRVFVIPNDSALYKAQFAGADIARFADATGRIQFTYDAATLLTIGASPLGGS